METISNESLTVRIDKHGAELQNIIRNSDDREFLWQGDPRYWKRRSPVLFPIVGSLWNSEMRVGGKTYGMSQHGFARDMDFELVSCDGTVASYRLCSNSDTLAKFPFAFQLEIGYELKGNSVDVKWKVSNPSTTEMLHFQIGAHPAFNYMNYDPDAKVQGYFSFDGCGKQLELSAIGENGCLKHSTTEMGIDGGKLPITRNTFDGDALIFENSQVKQVTLRDNGGNAYLQLAFDAPVVGLWSPARDSYAPFVCIEPWYGRCDKEGYDGEFASKDWTLHLAPGQSFSTRYTITIL